LRGQVFTTFTRIDGSRNRETGGYGLGLAVVARVAELHGGVATVNSSPSLGGARFSISWPARQVLLPNAGVFGKLVSTHGVFAGQPLYHLLLEGKRVCSGHVGSSWMRQLP